MSEPSTQLEITDLDPFDDAAVDEFHAVYDTAQSHGREATATTWERDELRASLQEDGRRRFRHGLCGRVDGRMVATGFVEGSLLHNLELGEVQVNVLPLPLPSAPMRNPRLRRSFGAAPLHVVGLGMC